MSTSAKAFGSIAAGIAGNTLSRQTRALLERGDNPRSGQPVWRNSYYEGTIEHRIWKRIGNGTKRDGRRFTGALMAAARRVELESRAKRRETDKGCQNGKLGVIGLEVLQTMVDLVDFMKGRLEPAIATIAERIWPLILGGSFCPSPPSGGRVHRLDTSQQTAGRCVWLRPAGGADYQCVCASHSRKASGMVGPDVQQATYAGMRGRS